jgi:hypothetical protein
MVNERYDDKFEGHEEGEYHFSDDQANYELDNENSTGKEGTVVAPLPKESMAEKLKNHRRIVIGIVIFIVLLGIVYKLVMPSTTTPATDFSQQGTSTTTTKTTTTKVTTPITTQPANTVSQQQPVVTQPTTATPAISTTTTAPEVVQQPAMPQQQPVSAPAAPAVMPQQQPVTATDAKAPLDRIATLEQQNSEMMSLLQTQYSQKLADAEAQNTELRAQVQELTSRVSSMEVAFKQLTKILRNGPPATPGYASAPPRPMRVAPPRLAYTVQAIIPGRAWLKSDSGETVTVAEGDALRGVGRITKIDPYDGIVNIDTGNKVVTLSYGASGD